MSERTPAGETPPDTYDTLLAEWEREGTEYAGRQDFLERVFTAFKASTRVGAPDVSLAATPDYTTRAETAAGDLRNGLQILDAVRAEVALMFSGASNLDKDLAAVARLLRAALRKIEKSAP